MKAIELKDVLAAMRSMDWLELKAIESLAGVQLEELGWAAAREDRGAYVVSPNERALVEVGLTTKAIKHFRDRVERTCGRRPSLTRSVKVFRALKLDLTGRPTGVGGETR